VAEPILLVEDLYATVEDKEILRGVNLKILPGEIHAIMGPNGSGKSTLANVLMGKPGYELAQGRILYRGEDLSGLAPEERARKGIFLAFQNPLEIPGVSVVNFLRTAYNASRPDAPLGAMEFRRYLQTKMDLLGVGNELALGLGAKGYGQFRADAGIPESAPLTDEAPA